MCYNILRTLNVNQRGGLLEVLEEWCRIRTIPPIHTFRLGKNVMFCLLTDLTRELSHNMFKSLTLSALDRRKIWNRPLLTVMCNIHFFRKCWKRTCLFVPYFETIIRNLNMFLEFIELWFLKILWYAASLWNVYFFFT